MADDTVRERALKAFAHHFPVTNDEADAEKQFSDNYYPGDVREAFLDGYQLAHADTLSAVLVELRAERERYDMAMPGRGVLNDAIARVEKLRGET